MASIQEGPGHQDDDYIYHFDLESLPELPQLANQWLEILLEDSGLLRETGGVSSGMSIGRAKMDNGQVIRVRRTNHIAPCGYRKVSVVDEPPRTEKAILAALVMLQGVPADTERLKTILSLLDLTNQVSLERSLSEAFNHLREESGKKRGKQTIKKRGRFISDLMAHRPLNFALVLLRHYRPDFDELPQEEQQRLLQKSCERVNEVLASVRLLSDFLEYGSPDRGQRDAVENPHRDVEAAVLRDVEGLEYRQIAEKLSVDLSESSKIKRDYSTVREMVRRGRDILRRALGGDGWGRMLEDMKAEFLNHGG